MCFALSIHPLSFWKSYFIVEQANFAHAYNSDMYLPQSSMLLTNSTKLNPSQRNRMLQQRLAPYFNPTKPTY